ncbi:MAG: hypothetical protein IJ496_02590 [Ruminococcus sp.]|nr:hypothetical protein [Ruminococcus sp.]
MQEEEKHLVQPEKPSAQEPSSGTKKKKNKGKSFLETVREIDEKERQREEELEEKRQQILEERRKKEKEAYEKKIREERIELMRLKQGVITESEIIHEEKEEKPRLSVWKKITNFLYHSKWWLGITVFLVGVFGYMIVDYILQVRPDMIVMVLTDDANLQLSSKALSEYFEQYIEDYNEDGKVTVDIYPIPVNDDTSVSDYYTGNMTKLSSQFQLADSIMVITDAVADEVVLADETMVNLEELFPENKNVRGTGFYLRNTDFTEQIGSPELVLDRDICVSLRKVVRTFDSEEEMQENYDIAYGVLEKMMEDLPYERKTRTLEPAAEAAEDTEGGLQ